MARINKTIIVNAFHRRAKKRHPKETIAKITNHIGPFLCLVNSGACQEKRGFIFGRGGIRTLEPPIKTVNGLANRCFRPLSHPSNN